MHFRSTIDTSRDRTRRYNLSYSISLKKFICFNLRKKRCSEASRFKVGSSLSFSNLEVSEIISSIVLLQSFQSKTTTPFPLSGFDITISLFSRFIRRDFDVVYVEKILSCGNKN